MRIMEGGVTSAKGFLAGSAQAGIKYEGRDDMALVYSMAPAQAAGVFTQNVVKAAPVVWDMKRIASGDTVRAVVLNSGIANACTGSEGMKLNMFMAAIVAEELKIATKEVLTGSTGVIGMQIPREPLTKGAALLAKDMADGIEAGSRAARAIMTTDTLAKESACEIEIFDTKVTVGGMSKGSGMIHPNMATMLSVITTDAVISNTLLQEILDRLVKDSFNMISVDRDTSTNDTCIILANGASKTPEIQKGTKEAEEFEKALSYVMKDLAKRMAADGEGASKLIEVTMNHCTTKEQAVALSKSVISSSLVKTAVFGSDANWGRILCAMGYAGVAFDPDIVDIELQADGETLILVKDGTGTDYSEDKASDLLDSDEVKIIGDIKQGDETATAWGCDLTYDYVKINGDYRS